MLSHSKHIITAPIILMRLNYKGKMIIRDILIAIVVLWLGTFKSTNRMIAITKGWPIEWMYDDFTDIHINILKLGVNLIIIIAVIAVIEAIVYFVRKKSSDKSDKNNAKLKKSSKPQGNKSAKKRKK